MSHVLRFCRHACGVNEFRLHDGELHALVRLNESSTPIAIAVDLRSVELQRESENTWLLPWGYYHRDLAPMAFVLAQVPEGEL